jgi:diaminopropionate ammonia-lyase
VEPLAAACALASARAGHPVDVPGPHTTVMSGLAAGVVSPVAWPDVQARFDGFCALEDEAADEGVRRLAALGLDRGECAGAALGAATALLGRERTRADLGIDESSEVLLLLTEGVTDPERFARVVSNSSP